MPTVRELADRRALDARRSSSASARRRARRARPGGGRVVAVTKTVDAERIRAAVGAGFDAFGENRVQERAAKADALGGVAGEWHLVGPLQSNKARRAVELFDVIESVDSLDLARRLDRIAAEVRPGAPLRVLLQVNVDDDAAKSGFEPADLERDLPAILALPALAVEGLMTVGRLVDSPGGRAPDVRRAARRCRSGFAGAHAGLGGGLSMGMTDDYPVAVEEGATIVRIGRAIFGARPTATLDSTRWARPSSRTSSRFVLIALWAADPRARDPVVDRSGGSQRASPRFVVQTTEPLLAPVRRLLPRTGMFDLSPLIVLLVLGAIMRAIA